jgi:hypothetical protein
METAGAVEGVFRSPFEGSAGKLGVLVVVTAAKVDGEAPIGGGAPIPESAKRQYLTVGKDAVDVGEGGPEAKLQILELRPALPLPSGQLEIQGRTGAIGNPQYASLPGNIRSD